MFEASTHIVKEVSKCPQAVTLAVYYVICPYKFSPQLCD